MPTILFRLKNKGHLRAWLNAVAQEEQKKISVLTYIFCSDEELLAINQKHLQHDDYTDIITFDYTEGQKLAGDMFISVERVRENARLFDVTFEQELMRVMVHGVLHLAGYQDKTDVQKKKCVY